MAERTQRERVTARLRDGYGADPEYLWARFPNYAVFRHPASKKWFALLADVPRDRLGLEGEGRAEILNLRCDPNLVGPLLSGTGFLPAYHMSKTSWITALLDGTVPDRTLFPLLELSYGSAAPRAARRRKKDEAEE